MPESIEGGRGNSLGKVWSFDLKVTACRPTAFQTSGGLMEKLCS